MSQEDLAERAGVARDTIQALELGRRTSFRTRTKRKLDKALKWIEGEGIEALEAGQEPAEDGSQAADDPLTAAVVELFTASIARLGQLADDYGRSVGDPNKGARWVADVLDLRDRAFELARQQSSENRQRYA
jgi:transcriptional regulator with XRE-family HTH domain